MDKEMFIGKFMDLSTSHITEDVDKILSNKSSDSQWRSLLVIYDFEYGYWIHVPDDGETFNSIIENASLPDCLFYVLQKAYDNGCLFIKLDSDGVEHEDLRKYDW
jgi:hypothetical protein